MIDLCTQGGKRYFSMMVISIGNYRQSAATRTKTQEPKRYDGFLHAKLHAAEATTAHWFSKEESTTAFFLFPSSTRKCLPAFLSIIKVPFQSLKKLWEKPFYQNGLLLLKWNYVMIGIWEQQQNICQKWILWIFEVSF